MADTKKSRPRRGGKSKAASSSQRTLVDMFGGKVMPPRDKDKAHSVVELSDTDVAIDDQLQTFQTADVESKGGIPLLASQSVPTSQSRPLHPIFSSFTQAGTVQSGLSTPSSPLSGPPSEIIELVDSSDDASISAVMERCPVSSAGSQSSLGQEAKGRAEGTTRDDPIVIESPPSNRLVVNAHPPLPAKSLWSIFNKGKPKPGPSDVPPRSGELLMPKEASAPFPDASSQHVRGPQTAFSASSAPFRTREKAQHSIAMGTAGLSTTFHGTTPVPPSGTHIPSDNSLLLTTSKDADQINSMSKTHRTHPAVTRLMGHVHLDDASELASSGSHEQWTDKWHPKRADEVIGNEARALYLRDWLIALQLQTADKGEIKEIAKRKPHRLIKRKKPNIFRHVKKRRKLGHDDYDEEFVVPDDDLLEEDDLFSERNDEDFSFCREMHERLNPPSSPCTSESIPRSSPFPEDLDDVSANAPHKPTQFGREIGNTILLTGPPGSGKTAAVYACAEELGWEVFEVYPGIGERSGAALNKLIGDVAKNHIVKPSQHTRPAASGLQAPGFFQSRRRGQISKRPLRIDSEDEVGEDETRPSNEAQDLPVGQPVTAHVTQSIVLVEEVDILYQTDTNFWPALINIIKECRRPVVLTCNDLSLIPQSELPLQATLQFEPCPAPLATSYLQALCIAEHCPMERSTLATLYGDKDLLPRDDLQTSLLGQTGAPDLRHAINQIQFYSSFNRRASAVSESDNPTPPESVPQEHATVHEAAGQHIALSPFEIARQVGSDEENLPLLRKMDRNRDADSFTDSYLSNHLNDRPNEYLPSGDDELGYKTLFAESSVPGRLPVSAFYKQDEAMVGELSRLTREVLGFGSTSPRDETIDLLADETRSDYVTRTAPVFAHFRLSHTPADNAPLYMDYLPWIRYMVEVDDAIGEQMPAGSQTRRRTRNSQKVAEARYLGLDSAGRQLLASTAFQ